MIVAARISYISGGTTKTLGVASGAYFADASGLVNKTWYPILDPAISFDLSVTLPWESGSSRASFGALTLVNGADGLSDHILDEFLTAQVSGQIVEVRRGSESAAFADLELWFKSKTDRVAFDGEFVTLSQRPRLDRMLLPLNTTVFGDGTPNRRLVNVTRPAVLGDVFQIEPLLEVPNQLRYFAASNLSVVRQVQEGGNVTTNWTDVDNGFQMTASPSLQVTAHISGPPKPATDLEELLGATGTFESWTSDDPDGITVFESPPDSEISQNVTQGADIVTSIATADASTNNTGTTAAIQPASSGRSLVGIDASSATVTDVASFPGLIDADDTEYLRWRLGGANITGQRLTLTGFGVALADVPTGVEVKIRSDKSSASPIDFSEVRLLFPDGSISDNKASAATLTTTKTQHVFGGPNDSWGAILGAASFGDGFGIRLNFTTGASGSFPVDARVYEIIVTVHTGSGDESVRLYFSPTLASGARYRVRITHTGSSEQVEARWGGVASSGAAIPWLAAVAGGSVSSDLSANVDDPFSVTTTTLEDTGVAEFEFVADGPVFGMQFFRLPGQTGTMTINRIELEEVSVSLNTYSDLVPYMATLAGLDVADVDTTSIDAHDAACNNPPLGWYIDGNETMEEIMDLFARSLSGTWWPDRDAKIRSTLWRLDTTATADFELTAERIDGDVSIVTADAEESTERAYAARNWLPIDLDRAAAISTTFTEQQRADIAAEWRVIRRADFATLNPWPDP